LSREQQKLLSGTTTANLENDTEKRKESHSELIERLTGKKKNSQILKE